MDSILLPLTLIILALLLVAFGPARAGAAGLALARRARAVWARLGRGPSRHIAGPSKRTR